MSTPYRSLNDDRPTPVVTNGHLSPDPNEYFSDSDSDSDDPSSELPESYTHQTPWEAITSGYGLTNWILSTMVNFGLNIGVGYGVINGVVGVWNKPSTHDGARSVYSTQMAVDLALASFFITFFTSWLASNGIVKAVKNGQVRPIDGESLCGGIYRFYPLFQHGVIRRAWQFAIVEQFIYCGVTLIYLAIICSAGGFNLSGSECEMSAHTYIWLKGFWCAGQAFVVYPFILFAALNKHTLGQTIVDIFVQQQLLKLEDEQGGPPSPVVKQYQVRDFGKSAAGAPVTAAPTMTLNS